MAGTMSKTTMGIVTLTFDQVTLGQGCDNSLGPV
jgi:hypothetical protein